MKLLICTQKVDKNDPVLGFFHGWIIEFSKRFESITVICLQKGEYDLPKNVKVLSLGKEDQVSRIVYVWRFYKYIWAERRNYDRVFVHMNQEYILLGWKMWKLFGKKIYMWRNHYAGTMLTDIAALFCTHVFCTSKYSYTAKYKKTVFMPVGIDTNVFKPDVSVRRMPHSILSLGRVSPSKNIGLLIDALNILKQTNIDFVASIYGDALPQDVAYLESLKRKVEQLDMGAQVTFYSGVPNYATPQIYSAHEIFVNMSPSGMYDKTIFEAMACGTASLSCNKNLKGVIDDKYMFEENSKESLATTLKNIMTNSGTNLGGNMRSFVETNHSLQSLGVRLLQLLSE